MTVRVSTRRWLPPQPIGPVTRTVCGGLLSPFGRPDAISGGPNDQGELGRCAASKMRRAAGAKTWGVLPRS